MLDKFCNIGNCSCLRIQMYYHKCLWQQFQVLLRKYHLVFVITAYKTTNTNHTLEYIFLNPLKAERHSNLWKSEKLIPCLHIICTSSHRIEDGYTKKVSESERRFLQSLFALNCFPKHKQLKYCVQLMIMTKQNIWHLCNIIYMY